MVGTNCPQANADSTKRTSGNGGPGGGAGGCPGLAETPPGPRRRGEHCRFAVGERGLTFDAVDLSAGTGGAGGEAPSAAYRLPEELRVRRTPARRRRLPVGAAGAPASVVAVSGAQASVSRHTGGAPKLVNGAKAKAGAGGAAVPAESKTFQDATWTLSASATGTAEDVHAF